MRTRDYDFNALNNIDDIYAIKILLCYFLKKINRQVTPAQLLEIATGSDIVNYFAYNHAIDSMLKGGLIKEVEIDGITYYSLSERGLDGAEEFKTMAPKTARERILSEGLKFFTRLKNENTVKLEIRDMEKGKEVYCLCTDNGVKLMELSLFAPDMEQAEFLRKKIKLNPQAVYSKLIDTILENEEFIPDISE